jgi:hypothetical protein
MKKTIFILVFAFSHFSTFASHLMGGEIIWKCQPNGQFVFTMILYRDCAGIPIPTGAQTLEVYGSPGLTSINLPQWSVTDITYCQPSYNCYSANPPAGATEQGIYVSNPVTLNGVPPAGGWTFAWHSCCRNGALTNVSPNGFSLRATMFPYNNQNVNTCFDNSPAFAERPQAVTCTSNPFVYNHGAFDDDMDSLYYEWGQPLEEPTNLPPSAWIPGSNPTYSTFNAPYDYLHPFPFSAPNIGATIDPYKGEINLTSFAAGNFVSDVKVTSYKCGIKVSEIFREIQIVILGTCLPNNNPTTQAPFQDTSGNYTIWADTVSAGDFVSFNISTSDFDLDTAGNPQSVTLSAYGSQFGANFSDTASGCLVPPCAIITSPMPTTSPIAATATFNWQTTVDHLGMFYPCAYIPNTYYFNFKSTDSHCPAPAVDYKTVAITVLPVYPRPTIQNNNGILSCMESNFDYQWYMNRFPVNGATSQSYTPIQQGMYQVRITDSLGSGNYSDGTYVSVLNAVSSQPSGLENISLYPNPAAESIEIQFTENFRQDITLCLYDMTGRCVWKKMLPGFTGKTKMEVSLRGIPSGVYTFEIGNGAEVIRKKVIVAKK